ncbi:MAG: hypothetical protein COS94_01650 [Candidatus Hydrogenedentes bacterium CG07_land_8_20_14_0_80_42_17]|nr:MAG: hypothetical protein COS94_01650 [Candidatus Hydrogenedentes bacterium CG07_land_8_20_14_0_80_42_17]
MKKMKFILSNNSSRNLFHSKFAIVGRTMMHILLGAMIMNVSCGITNKKYSEEDKYLLSILHETWSFLDEHRSASTGFPWDCQDNGEKTNTTNIGLYLASVPVAVELGFIEKKEGLDRIEKIVNSLYRLEHRHGFLPNWISVDADADTRITPGVCAISDFNKLISGLLVCRAYFPELSDKITPLIERVDWKYLWNDNTGMAYGIDLQNDKPIGNGRIWIASDVRSAIFSSIASGKIPPEYWDKLDRPRVKTGELEWFAPGYEWGGLFMQAMDNIFLDERNTEMGASIADFAWHQIRTAKTFNLPLWGWSNCNVPGAGYTEGGFLPLNVVTPHVSALVMEYYPKHAIENLKAFELRGMRDKFVKDEKPWGFRDSYDLRCEIMAESRHTASDSIPKRVFDGRDRRYLSLDQAMLFLSIANYVEDGIVRKIYASDPFVKKGIELLKTHIRRAEGIESLCAARDNSEALSFKYSDTEVALDTAEIKVSWLWNYKTKSFISADSSFDLNNVVIRPSGGAFASCQSGRDALELEFSFPESGDGEIDAELLLPQAIDMRIYKNFVIELSGKSSVQDEAFGNLRIFLRDECGQSQLMISQPVRAEFSEMKFGPFERSGIFAQPNKIKSIMIKFWLKPWYFTAYKTNAKKGILKIRSIRFSSGVS